MARPRRSRPRIDPAAALIAALVSGPALAATADPTDLREVRVGMPVTDLPMAGFDHLTCRGPQPREIASWQDWRTCPADERGQRTIGFRYDDARKGTKVAGHPALLSLRVGEDARVDGLEIETDPKAPMFLRKKGFLLGLQARAHWGDEGWTCETRTPSGDESPIGDTFVKEVCRKALPHRTVTVLRELYRPIGQELRAFVSRTRISIAGTD
ncbi:hypothetical protein [uncultured Methylobacterium sp.]|jgi:hypothetical protein|uniref:hypothetical protein n=1 Tax=uncultured Methylobacterium sp. TaxID=157278 RepID=UPI002605AF38|nr:hypothetical protein [uncultured Methylobacterium sp.]